MNFDEAFDKLLGHEGGYANDPRDAGGETYKGVARRKNPQWSGWARIDMHKGSLNFAVPEQFQQFVRALDADAVLHSMIREFYRTEYWARVQADVLPAAVRFDAFDMAVNSGVTTSIRLLQRTVCVEADGVIGPQTMTAIRAMPSARFVAHFNAYRLAYLTSLPSWPAHGRGWVLRCVDNILSGT
jgi:lysozyme family protein